MTRAERVGVIVPAAGDARRLGGSGSKALVQLDGRPLLSWALEAVEANEQVDHVVVAANADSLDAVDQLLATGGFGKVAALVPGGPTRRASVAAGLAALRPGPELVAVHDACRPLLRPGAIDRLAQLLGELGGEGIAPGAAVTDTIRRVVGPDSSGGIVHRDGLRSLQTPQVFTRAALVEAHRRAAAGELDDLDALEAASDAVLLERAGFGVAVVPGEPGNLAIATALDFEVAEVLAERGPAAR
jgi:2-C-methyl-D-erythritol 4-phosphate cytidylyltransferase